MISIYTFVAIKADIRTYLLDVYMKRMYVQTNKVDVVDASKDPRKLFSPLSCRAKPL